MSALQSARNTPMKDLRGTVVPLAMEAATVIYLGSIVAVNDNGYAVPAAVQTGVAPYVGVPKVMGIARNVFGGQFGEDARNVVGASMIPSPGNLGSAGALIIEVEMGVALLNINDGTIVQSAIGSLCYACDDNSVSLNDGWGETSYVNESHPSGTSPFTVTLSHVAGGVDAVVVHSANPGGTVMQLGLDYTFVPATGVVTLIPGGPGGILASTTYYFDYMNTTVVPVVVAAGTAATVPTAALGYHLDLKHENIVLGSVVGATTAIIGITDTTQATVLKEGVDFNVDYQAGIITFIPGGAGNATAADALTLGYQYKGTQNPTRAVVGRVHALEKGMVWVDLRDKALLAI